MVIKSIFFELTFSLSQKYNFTVTLVLATSEYLGFWAVLAWNCHYVWNCVRFCLLVWNSVWFIKGTTKTYKHICLFFFQRERENEVTKNILWCHRSVVQSSLQTYKGKPSETSTRTSEEFPPGRKLCKSSLVS